MKKVLVVLLGLAVLGGAVCGETAPRVLKKAAKAPAAQTAPKNDKLFAKVSRQDIIFYTAGTMYMIQSEGINSAGNMMYFAAKDFTNGKDLITKKIEKIEKRVDTPEKKIYKITMLLGDKSVDPAYRLEVYAEILKGYPFIALYSKFFYLGGDVHNCGVNWGLSSPYSSDPYKYYTIPREKGLATYRLAGGGDSKIGYARWLYLHNGKGFGVGLICPAMIGKGSDFIFVNSVPPQKDISGNETADVFMIYMPIAKNFKILDRMYNESMKMSWDFE